MMNDPDSDSGVVEAAVKGAIEKEYGVSASDLDPDADLIEHPAIGAAGFYRIIADIEQRLRVGAFEGNWRFDQNSVNGLVQYYRKIVTEKDEGLH